MARRFGLLAIALVAPAMCVTPLEKVLSMLSEMVTTAKDAKHAEEVEFATFQQWCEGVRTDKTRMIQEETDQIEQLNADIQSAASDASVLGEEIVGLQASIAQLEAEADNATKVRKQERVDYEATHADFAESIDACERAIAVLKARSADVPQSLLQLRDLRMLSPHEKSIIDSLLSTSQAPEANAYEFQSSSVVGMLEKLAAKFKDEKLELEKAELATRGNYEVLMQRLTDSIKAQEKAESEKTATKAGRLDDEAKAKGDLSLTEKAKAEDEQALSDTLAECHSKSDLYEKNQVTRSDEIEALEKAVEILSSSSVKGNAETYLPSLLQRKTVLAQLRSSSAAQHHELKAAAAYLQKQAAKLGSRYLSIMATHVTEDPFEKVKQMIKDLIVKLMEEANAEADEHAFCQTELATNKQTRDIKTAEVEELTNKVDQLTAQREQLASEITKLSDAVAEIKADQAEATKMRTEEKATNTKTIADAKEGQSAVEQAIQVLREFYAKQDESASFVQVLTKKGRQPQEAYTGLTSESGGVLGMLDVILSDFSRLETETSTSEDQAAIAYKKFMDESNQDTEVKETEMKHKEKNKLQALETLGDTKKELELTQGELDAALEYYDKLKPDCVDTGLSYADRKQRREEEVASLQEALKILSGEDLSA